MHTIRYAVILLGALALFAAALQADYVTYLTTGAETSVENERDITILGWSAAEVRYRTSDGRSKSVAHANVVMLDRIGGTMGRELQQALAQIGSDPDAALESLARIKENGNDLDKEEAAFTIAQVHYNAVAADPSASRRAISAFQDYLRSYKAGYFARDAYRYLADLQARANQTDAARRTLREMIAADASLRREGNQWLGEFEASAGQWKPAIAAFKNARNSAGGNKNAEYLAQAWEGLCTFKDGDAPAARKLLEPIIEDDDFDDPLSEDDEIALAVAYRAMGDVHKDSELWAKAYDAYIKGAYYSWWTMGSTEGYCLAEAYVCAGKLEGTDEDINWRERRSKLRTALALGYPRELRRVDN